LIAEVHALFNEAEQVSPPELTRVLETLFGEPGTSAWLVERQELKPDVYRLQIEAGGEARSVIVKRLDPGCARRNQLVTERWLPAVDLGGRVPSLLGIAAESSGKAVWHVYEDLGNEILETTDPDPESLEEAVDLISQIHTRFAGHHLLAECRLYGDDFGAGFFGANVRDAIRSLEALGPQAVEMASKDAALRDRLLRRLFGLLDEAPSRVRLLAEFGAPETFLHGDLWTTNALIVPGHDGPEARLIDWDHVGVGPISYDLSTFLARFPVADRHSVLDLYRRGVGHCGWRLPAVRVLNILFDTAEYARLANRIIWPALAALDGQASWAFQELALLEQWLEELRPVLP